MVGWKEGAEASLGKCTVMTRLVFVPPETLKLATEQGGGILGRC